MLITKTTRGDVAILSLAGRLDFHARHDFQAEIQKTKESVAHLVILNMKEVTFIDSVALGLITVAYKTLEGANVRLVIADAHSYVQKILTLTNLESIIKMYPSNEEAMASRIPATSPSN
ncbi:STAS domain-containing protein [Candidatus Nitrospira salsa]|nr:MAG: hypothetical protein NPIRA01_38060 [Nitrospirales bacterium]